MSKILYPRMSVGMLMGGLKRDSKQTAILEFNIEMSFFSLHKPITPCTLICLHF